jgi:hypothetical protein
MPPKRSRAVRSASAIVVDDADPSVSDEPRSDGAHQSDEGNDEGDQSRPSKRSRSSKQQQTGHVDGAKNAVFDEMKPRKIHCAALESSVNFYHGTMSGCPKAWLASYDRLGWLKGWDSVVMAMVLPLYLRATALAWYDSMSKAVQNDYGKLCELFIKQFTITKTQMLAELDGLANRKQLQGESVESYLLDINQRCKKLKRSQELEFEHALQGLLPYIKQQVLLQQASSVDDIRRIGQLCELVPPPTFSQGPDVALLDMVATLRDEIKEQRETINKLTEGKQGPRTQAPRTQAPPSQGQQRCQWCGMYWCKGKTPETRVANCIAFNKPCHTCQRLHHFAKMCKTKVQNRQPGNNVAPQAPNSSSSSSATQTAGAQD